MEYNFVKIEKGSSKGAFIRVCPRKVTISKEALEKIGRKFSLYTDKKNTAILLKKDENGRTISESRSTYSITATIDMEEGRYFFIGEYDGGLLFKKC